MLAGGLSLAAQAPRKYTYTTVPGDPTQTRMYVLDNGLTVYLSRNEDSPRIQANIAVRAGSKHDPADATGLAHYLEHMLFKGTSRIGTLDWEQEKVLLNQISALYEQRRNTRDEAERARIYARIDSLSNVAARFAIPSEYDKMISSLGAKGTNAYTWVEQTVYINDIPSDGLEKWAMVEAERFSELVLRLFHTELETVYEEFNMGQDNDNRQASKALNAALFRNHPYGTQTTIGTGEHLKDPSMVKIHDYFSTYYVPNNIAIILAGDLDHDRTIAMIDRHFGAWKPKDLPKFTFEPEEPLSAAEQVEVFGPMAGWVDVAWRLRGSSTDDEPMAALIAGMLSNGQAGLIDLELLQRQKILSGYAYANTMHDHTVLQLNGKPKQGQSLEEVYDLLMEQVENLRQGNFEEWLIEAVVNDLRKSRIRGWSDSNMSRASSLTSAFILGKEWKEVLDMHDRMARITKQQVVDFARKHLGPGHVVLFKRTGENTDTYRVPKPSITPVPLNREVQSTWRTEWERVPAGRVEPVFPDHAKAITRLKLKNGVPLAHVANTTNELFYLYYIVDMGILNDRVLQLAVEYLPFLGTSRYTPAEFRKELFKLGLSLQVNVEEDRLYVSLSGLQANMDKGVDLLEHLLADARPDAKALAELINDIAKQRQDRLRNKGYILNVAMWNYARYGARSPFTDAMSVEEMRALDPEELVRRIKQLTAHEHRIFHYGKRKPKEVVALLNKAHRVAGPLRTPSAPREYRELETERNVVYFVDHDMVQTDVLMVSKVGRFNKSVLPHAALFNEYFGSGLSSIVFQEIREAKALAYSARASYTTPDRVDKAHYVRAFVGTQSDKLGDALDALLALMNEMPKAPAQFEGAKEAALRVIASDRITKERIYWHWESLQRLGLDEDPRRLSYERIPGITIEDMANFFDRQIKGRNYVYLVLGNRASVDLGALERLGEVRELSKEEVFGYGEDK